MVQSQRMKSMCMIEIFFSVMTFFYEILIPVEKVMLISEAVNDVRYVMMIWVLVCYVEKIMMSSEAVNEVGMMTVVVWELLVAVVSFELALLLEFFYSLQTFPFSSHNLSETKVLYDFLWRDCIILRAHRWTTTALAKEFYQGPS